MFLRNILEDAEKRLIKFKSSFDVYNVPKNDVSFQLFVLTLQGNLHEIFCSLLPKTITSWDEL